MSKTKKGTEPAPKTHKINIPNKYKNPQEYAALMDKLDNPNCMPTDNEQGSNPAQELEDSAVAQYLAQYAKYEYENVLVDVVKRQINSMIGVLRTTTEDTVRLYEYMQQLPADGLSLKERAERVLGAMEGDTSFFMSASVRDFIRTEPFALPADIAQPDRDQLQIVFMQMCLSEQNRTTVGFMYGTADLADFITQKMAQSYAMVALTVIAYKRHDHTDQAIKWRKENNKPDGVERVVKHLDWAWKNRWSDLDTIPRKQDERPKRANSVAIVTHGIHRKLTDATQQLGKTVYDKIGTIGKKNVYISITAMQGSDTELLKQIECFDRCILGTMFGMWVEQGLDVIFTPGTIFGTRHPGRKPKPAMQERIAQTLNTIRMTEVVFDIADALKLLGERKNKDYTQLIERAKKRTYLCPLEAIDLYTLNGQKYTAWKIYGDVAPPYFAYLRESQRFSSMPGAMLDIRAENGNLLEATVQREVIAEYMAMRVLAKGLETTILGDTIIKECGINPKHRDRALLFANQCMAYFERRKDISSYKENTVKYGKGERIESFTFKRRK